MDTSTEYIKSADDAFDIVVDYVKALRTDPVGLKVLGQINLLESDVDAIIQRTILLRGSFS